MDVTIDLEHDESPQVEMRVSAEHTSDFLAMEASGTVMAAVDGAIHKLEQQLRRHKEKLKAHRAIGLKHHESPSEPTSETE